MRLVSWMLLGLFVAASPVTSPSTTPPVVFNDNRAPAGTQTHGVLTVALVARSGEWRPLGPGAPGAQVLSFGEVGKPLQDPGPLLRVRQGTVLQVSVRNLTGAKLVVHGFSARRVTVMDSLVIAAGETGRARFRADAAGTFYYWGSLKDEDVSDRILGDAHLNGALIVDPVGARPAPDRVFVIERWVPDTTADGNPDFLHELMTINGRPWPRTERLTYDVGDSVRWRIINVSGDRHPFHLHGFYYRVDARGDFSQDTAYWPAQQRTVVTEPMSEGTTLDLAWSPDRPGGWIFHCHFSPHVMPNTGLPPDTETHALRLTHVLNGYPGMSEQDHAHAAMGGLILGIYVRPPAGWHGYTGARRTLRLVVESDSMAGVGRTFAYVLHEGDRETAPDTAGAPGPSLVLYKDEPTRIWVVNHAPEPTQVHWHGLEIESAYDGVGGTSGVAPQVAHPIAPGDSFEVLVTPPRAGTFIYHTHFNDLRQLMHGLYGALIVLDSGARWNPDSDRVFILGDDPNSAPRLNDGRTSVPLSLRVGVPYRFRLINITAFNPGLKFVLVRHGTPMYWVPLAKDGRTLPPWQTDARVAQQPVNVGETFDFQVQAADTGAATLEVRRLYGALVTTQPIRFGP